MELDGVELRAVVDELAIRRLVACYADAVNRADAEDWIETWAEDGRWTLGGNTSEGRESILQTWKGAMGLFEKVVQLPQDGLLSLTDDRATGRWSVIELGRSRSESSSLTLGIYHDVYRRVEESWKFGERRFEMVYVGAPDLSGAWLS